MIAILLFGSTSSMMLLNIMRHVAFSYKLSFNQVDNEV